MMKVWVKLGTAVRTTPFIGSLHVKKGSTPFWLIGRHASGEGPAFVVRQRIKNGQMKPDSKQTAIVEELQRVYEDILHYSPGKIISGRAPKGLYIHGSVGTGKTLLMDIFFESVRTSSKRRSHFNNFMADVHSRIHQLKAKPKTSASSVWGKSPPVDAVTPVARQLVKEAWLLCFDEFQVTDIADAMILKGLFTEMFLQGMVVVATSNRAPEELYMNGLQRVNFLPFIPVLKNYCKVVSISAQDYRTSNTKEVGEKYLITGSRNAKAEMEEAFKKLCKEEGQKISNMTLNVLGHQIIFKRVCGKVLLTSFKHLCEKDLGAADYIQIANHFHTVLIKDVPMLNMNKRNQTRRFITLIDTLYDKKVKLMMSAATSPQNLFSDFSNSSKEGVPEFQRKLMDDLQIDAKSDNARSSIFSGSEESFAVQRTISRITEMCTNTYWNQIG